MVLIVRVLFNRVEKGDLLLLVFSQVVSTVVSLLVLEFNFIDNLLHLPPVSPVLGVKGAF